MELEELYKSTIALECDKCMWVKKTSYYILNISKLPLSGSLSF